MLCTANKTYTIRSIVLSNSVLVATAGEEQDATPSVVVRDQLNEVLELVPSIPRLHKLDALLRGKEYDERSEEDDDLYAEGPAGAVSSYLASLFSSLHICTLMIEIHVRRGTGDLASKRQRTRPGTPKTASTDSKRYVLPRFIPTEP